MAQIHPTTVTSSAASRDVRFAELQQAIDHAAHLLPSQGPITVFVHHNTLHAFEDLAFDQAVLEGARIFDSEPYLSEDRYRQLFERGRIRLEDIAAVLMEDLDQQADRLIGFLGTRYHLRLAMLQHPLRIASSAELRWLVAETEALQVFRDDVAPSIRTRMIEETRHWVMRDLRTQTSGARRGNEAALSSLQDLLANFGHTDIEHWTDAEWESFTLHALWRMCHHGICCSAPPAPPHAASHLRIQQVLLEATGVNSDRLVHDLLIRFCAAFLDQGFAHWPLPQRDQGFYHAFLAVYGQPGPPPNRWMRGLAQELRRLEEAHIGPLESIDESLRLLAVRDEDRSEFLSVMLLSLRGFAGMLWQLETRGDRVAHPAPSGTLVGFLAVRLILERFAVAHIARETLGFHGELAHLRQAARQVILPHDDGSSVEQRAFLVFQLAQVLNWKPQDLCHLTAPEWAALVQELESFPSLERRRIYHHAYERYYLRQALDALTAHSQQQHRSMALPQNAASATSAVNGRPARPVTAGTPKFQVVCCIDDREESYRRHLEEIEPECETFGAAAFYGVAMYYRGAADAHFVPLCPIIIRPQHYVQEEPGFIFQHEHERRAVTRRMLGKASHHVHIGSRTLMGGLFASLFGSLASVPLVARVLFPRLVARLRRGLGSLVQPPPIMQLHLERPPNVPPGPTEQAMGFTVDEMAAIVERQLRDINLTSRFARIVIFTGHGSSSLNNPHESAYNCGACAGGRGGPNARAFAQMANDPRVRAKLAEAGLPIPAEVFFVGAYHNTCNDNVTFFDLDRLPTTHRADFLYAQSIIDRARERNAHERCRRFETAPLDLSPEAALRHVEGRAEDLAQTRPEYNHATNAMTIVGRRSRTRGLYLDRRTFLTSYDPTADDDQHTILARILQAAIPVCAGISLEYYFSCVDPEGWGCGTKLPHNVTSLLGVMSGAASDLRTGLSNQMVEIHEPLRQLFVIETTAEGMLQVMQRNATIERLCRNGWVHLAVLDPQSSAIQVYRRGKFERYQPGVANLPEVASSEDWYRGWRDHLGFARVRPAHSATASHDSRMQQLTEGSV